jgi:hypothetical protein
VYGWVWDFEILNLDVIPNRVEDSVRILDVDKQQVLTAASWWFGMTLQLIKSR